MKTQISRQSFTEQKRYSGVYQQMGRMITDADWNELTELLQFEVSDAMEDVIGSGAPAKRGLVQETPSGDYALKWGYVYVDGLRGKVVPTEASAPPSFVFTGQADFPEVPALTAGEYRLYVDLWERTVTHLEDRDLLDSALKGADTCTRTQRMAQVKACPLDVTPEQLLNADGPVNPAHGRLKVSVELNAGETLPDPCDPCADELALHDEVGNYLFRVEVHEAIWDRSGSEPELTELWLKWSSENGAEQYEVGVTPPGFTAGGWVYEFFSAPDQQMTTEKHVGHHLQDGFTPQRGVLRTDPTDEPAGLGLIRRWDGYVRLVKDGGDWTLEEGWDRGRELSTEYGSNAHGFVDLGGPVHINLDAVSLDVDMDEEIAVPGDHWLAPVRQAEHEAGDVLLDDALPEGIVHHYLVLGTVEVGPEGQIDTFTPDDGQGCTPFGFPPLTDLKARDVCYDNERCDMPQVRTVQDAIDYLCKARDLRWHHKHLHGMGVVCGLIVECGPDTLPDPDTGEAPRRQVTVTRGSALDCEGNIIELEQTRHFDVMAALEPLLEENPDVLDNGTGTLCIWIEAGPGGDPVLKLEPYESQGRNAWLDGTIWMDFYQHCVKDLVDEFKSIMDDLSEDDIADDEDENGVPVSSRRKEATAVLNLFAQLIYRPQGQWVFLSEREHVLLRTFYIRMRELVQSKTFCGMSAGQPFPEYPFPNTRIQTAFGKHHHERVLVHPSGSHTLTYGGTDTTVNVYDNSADKVAHISTIKAGEGAQITAMAFEPGPSAELVYAATAINVEDSLLNRGRFNGGKIEWESSVVLCGVEATDLQFLRDDNQRLFMLGLGKGLYRLNLVELFGEDKFVPEPQWPFDAFGPIAYDLDNRRAYAAGRTQGSDSPDGVFDGIADIQLDQTPDGDDLFPLKGLFGPQGNVIEGTDTVAFQPGQANRPSQLHVVVQTGPGSKSVYSYRLPFSDETRGPAHSIDGLEHTEIDLVYHPKLDRLMIAIQDEFRIITAQNGDVQEQWVPVQLMPTALAVEPNTQRLVVLNYMSNTLTLYPVDEIDGSKRDALAQYRLQILLAFVSLIGNLLQYLKDCFCHHLLIQCPQCDEDDKVYLARIDIRNNKVYKVCNFGKRKNVWTFPKFEYWLSIVPVLPMFKKAIGEFCCMVMPNLFGGWMENYEPNEPSGFAVKGRSYKRGVYRTKTADPKRSWRESRQDIKVNARLMGDAAMNKDPKTQRATVSKQAYRNLETQEAVKELEKNDVKVNRVVKYDAKDAPDALRRHALTPDRIEKGSEVVVYEENGKAAFYALKQPDAPGFNTALAEEEITQLRIEKDQLVTEIRRAEADLHALKTERTQSEAAVESLKDQFRSLEQQRSQAMADMQTMRTGVQSLEQELKALKVDMAKSRPVKDIADITDDDEAKLKETGIRNLGELALSDVNQLSERTGIEKTKAERIITSAKKMVKIQPE